jgi:hypothetical protein
MKCPEVKCPELKCPEVRCPKSPTLVEDPIVQEDRYTMKNPLSYPESRLDRHNMDIRDKILGHKASIFTRGYPDTPKLMGYLYQVDNRSKVLPLFGYETYPNSQTYKYYTIISDIGLAVHLAPKIPIEYYIENDRPRKINGKKLYDDDIVQVNDLDHTKYIVKILEYDSITLH